MSVRSGLQTISAQAQAIRSDGRCHDYGCVPQSSAEMRRYFC